MTSPRGVDLPSGLPAARSGEAPASQPPESEAERVFLAAVLEESHERAPDIESLCNANPQHASELRLLHASWKRAHAALHACSVPPLGASSKYRVLGEIAEGGMGAVFSVWDASLGRPLAMKVLKRDDPLTIDPAVRERARVRLLHEAQILGRLQHPSIVPVHERGDLEDGDPYFTMLQVQGLALSDILPRIASGADGWTLPRAIRVLLQVCEAVAHAHSQGIVHRDLKPANVMVGRFGETYVMDWGLAKASDFTGEADVRVRPGDPDPPSDSGSAGRARAATPLLTMEGNVLGTPAYMSPEQARGRLDDIGQRSDVYSAGAILYHLLAGEAPYDADRGAPSPHEILERVLAGAPAPLVDRAPRAPAELIAIAEKAMARDATDRYETMQDLAEDLRAWLEVRVVRAYARGAWAELRKWVRRNKGAAAAVLVGVVALAALALFQSAARHRQALLEAGRRQELYNTHVSLASQALSNLDGAALSEQLDACPEDQRGWEWHYLHNQSDTSDRVIAHPGEFFCSLAWSPDDRWIASGTKSGRIFLHEIDSDRSITLRGRDPIVWVLAYSPDGKRLYAGSKQRHVDVWDLASQEVVLRIDVKGDIVALFPTPDGTRLRVAAPYAMEFDAVTGERTSWAPATDLPVVSCKDDFTRTEGFRYPLPLAIASHDFERLLVIDDSRSFSVLRTEDGSLLGTGQARLLPFRFLNLGPDGRWIATCDEAGNGRLQEVGGDERDVRYFASPSGPVGWTRAANRFVCLESAVVVVRDVETGHVAQELVGHRGAIHSTALSNDGRWCATGCDEIRLWDLERPERERSVEVSKKHVRQVAASPRGDAVACVTLDGILEVRDVATRAQLHRFEGTVVLESLAWSPDGSFIATGGRDGRVRVWDLQSSRVVHEYELLKGSIGWLAFHPDGRHLAFQPYFLGKIGLLDLESGSIEWTLEESFGPAALSPDGTFIAGVDSKGVVKTFEAHTGALRSSWQGGLAPNGEPQGIVISPDGTRMALRYTWALGVALHDVRGELLGTSAASDVSAFLPQGNRLLASGTRSFTVLDGATARPIAVIHGPIGPVAVFPDGTLVVGTQDGRLAWWSAAPWKPSLGQ